MLKKIVPCLLLTFLFCCTFEKATADTIKITPTRICFSPKENVAVLHLTNDGDHAIMIQSKMHAWFLQKNNQILRSSNHIIVMPPLFELPSHKTQLIRLFLKRPNISKSESTYRLYFREVLQNKSNTQNDEDHMRLDLQMSLPVFVLPQTPVVEKWSWHARKILNHLTEINIINDGNVTLFLSKIKLFDKTNKYILTMHTFAYILPHQTKFWKIRTQQLPTRIYPNVTYPCVQNSVSENP